MTLNVTALPDGAGAPPALRLGQQTPVSAAGVNDPAALARQQMVNATPAPSIVAAYSANIQPPPKLTTRNPVSSPLAAQFIAQNPGATVDELSVFEAQTVTTQVTTAQETSEDDFFASIRIARDGGEMAPIASATKQAAGMKQTAEPIMPEIKSETGLVVQEQTSALRSGLGQLAASLPALFAPLTKSVSFTKARGMSAYQIALNRNAATKKSEVAAAL